MPKRLFRYVLLRDGNFYGISSVGNVRKLIVDSDILRDDWLYSSENSQWIKAGDFGQLEVAFKSQAQNTSNSEMGARPPLRLPKLGKEAIASYQNLLPGPKGESSAKKVDRKGPSSGQSKFNPADWVKDDSHLKGLNRRKALKPEEEWNPYPIDSELRKDYEAAKSIRFQHEDSSSIWNARTFFLAGAIIVGLAIIYLIISSMS